jgi:hypothetical protein
MRYTAYLNSKSPENKLNSSDYDNLCVDGGITFNIDQEMLASKPIVTYANVTANVYDRCSNDTSILVPVPTNGVFAVNGAEITSTLTDSAGMAQLSNLIVGTTYTLRATARTDITSPNQEITVAAGDNTVDFYFDKVCDTSEVETGATGGTQ